jgi:hypothetical protein
LTTNDLKLGWKHVRGKHNITKATIELWDNNTRSWKVFNPVGKTLKAGKTYRVRLTFYKKAETGEVAILTYPYFGGYALKELTWWNTSWAYRIDNAIADGPRPYVLSLNISNAAGTNNATHVFFNGSANADFSDIRFTLDNTTLLSYWIEDNSTDPARVWVNVTGNGTVNLYYGSPNATSLSNGSETFDFFDDFSGDLSKWATGGTNPSFAIVGGVLKQSDTSDVRKEIYTTDYTSFTDAVLEAKLKFDTADSTAPWEFNVRRSAIDDTYRAQYRDDTNNVYWIDVGDTGNLNSKVFSESTGVWRDYRVVVYNSSGTAYLELWIDGTKELTASDGSPRGAGSVGLSMYGSVTYLDDVRVRRFVLPEPTWTAWTLASLNVSTDSWGNNYTNDDSLNISLLSPAAVRFNVTAGGYHTVDVYEWYVDGAAQGVNFDNFTYYFNVTGTHSVKVVATNITEGDSASLTWQVTLGFNLLYPANGSMIYTPYPPLTTDVNFSWAAVDYPYYNLRVARDNNFNLLVTDMFTSNTYASVGLDDGTYWWQVRSYNPDTGTYESSSEVFTFSVTHNLTEDGTTAIQGVVYENANDPTPLGGALVSIWNDTWTDSMITGSNGYYLFTGLDNSSVYSIQAKKSGYVDSNVELVVPSLGNWTTRDIYMERCISEWSCGFNQQYVEFVLLDVYGKPLPYVTVTVYKDGNPVAEYTGVTDTGGRTTFLLTKYQKYRITFINATQGVSEEITLYPKEDSYTIFAGALAEHSIAYWYTTTQNNTNNTGVITLHYSDWATPVKTSYVKFDVYVAKNNTLAFSQNLTTLTGSDTISTPSLDASQTYRVMLTVGHSDLGVFSVFAMVGFVVPAKKRVPLGDLGDWELMAFSLFILFALGLIFGAVSSGAGGVIVVFTAGILYYWGWMPLISKETAAVIFPFLILMAIVNLLINRPSKFAGGSA